MIADRIYMLVLLWWYAISILCAIQPLFFSALEFIRIVAVAAAAAMATNSQANEGTSTTLDVCSSGRRVHRQ